MKPCHYLLYRITPDLGGKATTADLTQGFIRLAGERILRDDDGRGHDDNFGHPIDRRSCGPGHGASHEIYFPHCRHEFVEQTYG
jgi:hypothetical protein